MRLCAQCMREIPVYKHDYKYTMMQAGRMVQGKPRVGTRLGSAAMRRIDPKMYFCTLRCAAEYGVRCYATLLTEENRK